MELIIGLLSGVVGGNAAGKAIGGLTKAHRSIRLLVLLVVGLVAQS